MPVTAVALMMLANWAARSELPGSAVSPCCVLLVLLALIALVAEEDEVLLLEVGAVGLGSACCRPCRRYASHHRLSGIAATEFCRH